MKINSSKLFEKKYVPAGSSYEPFDTSKILIRQSPTCENFYFETPGLYAGLSPIQIRNTHPTKVVLFTHIKVSLVTPDVRVVPNVVTSQRTCLTTNFNAFLNNNLGYQPAASDFSTFNMNILFEGKSLTIPEVYDNSFIVEEVAGLAYTSGTYSLDTTVNFAALTMGNVMESFKMTPNLIIPFNGEVILIQD